jgi:cholinesterase
MPLIDAPWGWPVGPLFGTFNRSTATPAEATWSGTFQTAIANFIKDPTASPALNWQKYVPGPPAVTLAKLAYSGNVEPGNFIDPVPSSAIVSVLVATLFCGRC